MTSSSLFSFDVPYLYRQMVRIFPSQTYCLVPGFISVSAREHVFCATRTFFAIFSGFNDLFISSRYVNYLFLTCC